MKDMHLSRRRFAQSIGIVISSFVLSSYPQWARAQQPPLPFSLRNNRRLDGWIRIDPDNTVTVFTGKAELGQGILTALAQIAAEELDLELVMIKMLSADTSQSPDEQYTFGSQSIEQSGQAVRAACAEARAILLNAAARQFQIDVSDLKTELGQIVAADGKRTTYWQVAVAEPQLLGRDVTATTPLKRPVDYRIVGTSAKRIDLPRKLTGGASYVQDMRLPGMIFGRVVRPPRFGATLISLDETMARSIPGVVTILRDGNFVAVAAEREERAIAARDALASGAVWSEDTRPLPDISHLREELQLLRSETIVVENVGQLDAIPPAAQTLTGEYLRSYLSQGSIGPSCAVAWLRDGHMTVWSHTQGAFPLRGDLAKVLGMATNDVDVVHVPGSGCYGHNGADDVALDAALLARAAAGKPVKLQWMRDDEFGSAPKGPAMAMRVQATLSADGRIVDWSHDVWSNSHAMRPGQAGGVNLLAAWDLSRPFVKSPAPHVPQPYGDGDRNAPPPYELSRKQITNHLLLDTPIRNGSFRTLGAHGNVFAIESFMDELANAAGIDPVTFRLMHLKDRRAIAVIEAAKRTAGWSAEAKGDGHQGRGFAYSRYKNIGMYAAAVVDIEVNRKTGEIRVPRVVLAADIGRIINPDGARNQLEGGIIQSVSLTLKEQVAFNGREITTRDWSSYPILTFPETPIVDLVLIESQEASLGAGEGSLPPTSAALANAFSHATGHRLRELPMTPERVRRAIA